jgi:hypothetical protein
MARIIGSASVLVLDWRFACIAAGVLRARRIALSTSIARRGGIHRERCVDRTSIARRARIFWFGGRGIHDLSVRQRCCVRRPCVGIARALHGVRV